MPGQGGRAKTARTWYREDHPVAATGRVPSSLDASCNQHPAFPPFAGTNTIFTLYIYGISEIRLGGCDRRVLAVTEISFPREGAENQVFYVEKYENYPPEGPPTSAIVDPAGRSSEIGQKEGPPFFV